MLYAKENWSHPLIFFQNLAYLAEHSLLVPLGVVESLDLQGLDVPPKQLIGAQDGRGDGVLVLDLSLLEEVVLGHFPI